MIIKIHKAGRSFKGVCRYLTHDAKTETAERVAWTHTLNLASDDVPLAVNEMLWTFRTADQLKRDAGVGTGGSRLEKPVKHFSLSWPHGEAPTKEYMIETVRAYMEHMGWSDRQAVLVAHNDTRHAHAHVVMNSVSPEDERRQIACDQLREKRDQAYEAILAQQRFDKTELTLRQHQGLRTYQLFDVIYPTPEPRPGDRNPSVWETREKSSQRRDETPRAFDRAARDAVDPSGRDHAIPIRPGVVQRSEVAPVQQPTDGFGRETKADERRESVADLQTNQAEVTEASSEKARADKAREMTEQAVAKGRDSQVAALRASWNKSRRSRGGRD